MFAAQGNTNNVKVIKDYKKTIQIEFSDSCKDILGLLDGSLIPEAKTGESSVFFYKMKGDYHRYFAEIDAGEDQKKAALEAYTEASKIAHESLAPTHPIRLGLALNFSVFYNEILKNPEKYVLLLSRML